jgi:hypothetical protein
MYSLLRLPTKTHRTNRHFTPDTKNVQEQLEIIIAIQDIQATH